MSPAVVPYLPPAFQGFVPRTAIAVGIYAVLLVLMTVANSIPLFRRLFDRKVAFTGQFISAHTNNDVPIVAVFELGYNVLTRKYEISGTAFDVEENRRPVGYWASNIVDIDTTHRMVNYIFWGAGPDARDDQSATRSLGFASVEFLDDKLEFGRGHFRDDLEQAKYIQTEVLRVNRRTQNLLKMKRPWRRRKSFEEKHQLVVAYRNLSLRERTLLLTPDKRIPSIPPS